MRIFVKAGIALLSIAKKIARVRYIITQMTGNPNFVSPSPSLAVVATAVNNLEAASIQAEAGGPDDTANMYNKEDALDSLVKQLALNVETTANANPGTAEAVILSSGFEVRAKVTRQIKDFLAALTGKLGEILLQQKGVVRGTHVFQMCTDPSNEGNWRTIYEGTRGRFLVEGLTPGVRYYFRAKVVTKSGPSDWTTVLSVLVGG